MIRIVSPLLLSALLLSAMLPGARAQAAPPPIDAGAVNIDTAADVYAAAAVRDQVSASLDAMPTKIRQMFAADSGAGLTGPQLDAVSAAAKRGFRIAVFEPPALSALAGKLDPETVKKTLAFLASDVGQRMVAADVALARLDEKDVDKVMSGEIKLSSTPERDALTRKLEVETAATDSAVEVYLRIGRAIAVGTAIGSGMDPIAAGERASKATTSAEIQELRNNLQGPLLRYLAYGYRDLSNADLERLSQFLSSPAGKRYVAAYNAAMSAGFDAMSERCGEQIGESWRELANAQLPPPADAPPALETPSPASPAH
jgi:hypothetical protein